MHNRKMRTALLTLTLLLPACAAQDAINWLGDYQEARKIAKQTGKPIFLEFRCEA